MSDTTSKKLSTEPYKGVRDFYPEDMVILKHIFSVWRKAAERYGYEEYNASILEPSELYRSKTSDEIVNEQTYTFTDRGDREVTLRPEMTPTVARMIAGRRRELAFPVRWYSIPNCFRYERPQRGRVREFWQLNVDIFGVEGIEADIEILKVAHQIMKEFGAVDSDFKIKINNRALLQKEIGGRLISPDLFPQALRLLDRKEKITEEEFAEEWKKLSDAPFDLAVAADESITTIISWFKKDGITNIEFDPMLTRGFDYYTGTVFEVFDTDPKNPRSLFGGGRYDRLLENFGGESLPAIGFGAGDVIIRDFIETHGLLPTSASATDLMVCVVDERASEAAEKLATELRKEGINVAVYQGNKKIGDQIKLADKKKIPFVVVVGEKEASEGMYMLKRLSNGSEDLQNTLGIAKIIKESK